MIKKIWDIIYIISCLFILWIIFSILEVGAHNTFFTGEYSAINMFNIFSNCYEKLWS